MLPPKKPIRSEELRMLGRWLLDQARWGFRQAAPFIPGEGKLRRVLPLIFFVIGFVLLIYVGAQYAAMYTEQHRLTRAWEQQNTPGVQDYIVQAESDPLTRLSIPKINLDAVVVEGTSRRQLLVGPGHVQASAIPGEAGNAVITAHRDTFFRHIFELNKGDEIQVRRRGAAYRYEVTGKRIVEPSDVSVIRPSDEARLTLITCYPTYYIGPAPERLVVFAKLVDHAGDSAGVHPAARPASARE